MLLVDQRAIPSRRASWRQVFTAIAVVVAVVATAASARANFITGNDLYQHCTSSGGLESGQGTGYLEAIVDVLETNRIYGGPACFPPGVQLGQVRHVITGALAANPAIRHLPADVLVSTALVGTFPRPK